MNDVLIMENEASIFKPSVPAEENQITYEYTDKTMSPLTGVTDLKPIERKDIELYPQEYAFVLYNVLSPSECQYYIDTAEKIGFRACK